MEEAPVVLIWVVVVMLRIGDMQAMCEHLSLLCKERGDEKLSRRLGRAGEAFKDMLKEMENVSRQQQLL